MTGKTDVSRLETPEMVGYRVGLPSSSVIGRKLGRVYDLPADMPREIGDLLQAIERKICQGN